MHVKCNVKYICVLLSTRHTADHILWSNWVGDGLKASGPSAFSRGAAVSSSPSELFELFASSMNSNRRLVSGRMDGIRRRPPNNAVPAPQRQLLLASPVCAWYSSYSTHAAAPPWPLPAATPSSGGQSANRSTKRWHQSSHFLCGCFPRRFFNGRYMSAQEEQMQRSTSWRMP